MIGKENLFTAAIPKGIRRFALNRSAFTTLAISILTGICILPVATLPLLDMVSIPLLLLLAVLFGPFAGVSVSLLYPLVEYWVGRKLGSQASFDVLYRLFAWSFFPLGLAGILTWSVILFLHNGLGAASLPVALIPLLIVLCFTVFWYGLNVLALHQLPKTRGVASMFITLIIFCTPLVVIVCIALLLEAVKRNWERRGEGTAQGAVVLTGFRKAVMTFFLFYGALFSWILFYDEKLNPPVAAALATSSPDIFSSDNGWLALLDFTSRAGGPPLERQEKRLRAVKAAFLAGGDTGCGEGASETEPEEEWSFQGKLPEFYGRSDNGIMEYATGQPADVERLLSDNRELLEKYDALYAYPRYAEPLDLGYCMPYPKFAPVRDIQKVKFLRLAQVEGQGDVQSALLALQADADFWRRTSIGARTLLSKMISLVMLSGDMRFAAELGARLPPGHDEEWRIVQSILKPFDQGETALTRALEGETIWSLLAFKSAVTAARQDSMMHSLLLKSNATRNRIYSYYQIFIAASKMTPGDFAATIARKEKVDSRIRDWSVIYNPVGEIILNTVSQPSIAGYIKRGHNLEGLRRLAQLKIMAAREGVEPSEMQRFLDAHRAEYGNPYTGESMQWDAGRKRIFLKQIDEDKDVEIFL